MYKIFLSIVILLLTLAMPFLFVFGQGAKISRSLGGLLSDDGTNVTLATGNFGIGTATPGAKLEVAGQIKITGGAPGVDKVLTSDAVGLGTWKANISGGGWTDNGQVVRLTTATDKVGIGTSNAKAQLEVGGTPGTIIGGFPSGNLHVTGQSASINDNAVITGHNLFGGNKQLWYFGSTSSSNDNIAFINRQNAELSLNTNNLTRFTIQADGDVGIGDPSPDAALEVLSAGPPQLRLTHTDNIDHLDISVNSAGTATLQASGNQINLGNTPGEVTVINDVLKILPRSAAPAGATGMIYVDSDLNLPCFYNGTNWVQMDDFTTVCS